MTTPRASAELTSLCTVWILNSESGKEQWSQRHPQTETQEPTVTIYFVLLFFYIAAIVELGLAKVEL